MTTMRKSTKKLRMVFLPFLAIAFFFGWTLTFLNKPKTNKRKSTAAYISINSPYNFIAANKVDDGKVEITNDCGHAPSRI
jgi:hypothetical protein